MSHYIGGSLIAAKGDNMNIDELNKAKMKLRKIYEKNNPKIEELDEYGNPIEPTGNLSNYKSMGSEYEANKIVNDFKTVINKISLLSGHFVMREFKDDPYNLFALHPYRKFLTITSVNSISYIYSAMKFIQTTLHNCLEMLQDLRYKNRLLFQKKIQSIKSAYEKCYWYWRNEFAEKFEYVLAHGDPTTVHFQEYPDTTDPYDIRYYLTLPDYTLHSLNFQKGSDKWDYTDFFSRINNLEIEFIELNIYIEKEIGTVGTPTPLTGSGISHNMPKRYM